MAHESHESAVDHGYDHNYEYDHVSQDGAVQGTDPCMILEEDIDILQQEIDILEQGMLVASGGQRAALAKELAVYHVELDSRKRELRQCRGALP